MHKICASVSWLHVVKGYQWNEFLGNFSCINFRTLKHAKLAEEIHLDDNTWEISHFEKMLALYGQLLDRIVFFRQRSYIYLKERHKFFRCEHFFLQMSLFKIFTIHITCWHLALVGVIVRQVDLNIKFNLIWYILKIRKYNRKHRLYQI